MITLDLMVVVALLNRDVSIEQALRESAHPRFSWAEVGLVADFLDSLNPKHPHVLRDMGFDSIILSRRGDGGVTVAVK